MDFLVVRASTTYLLVENSGLALSHFRDMLFEESLKNCVRHQQASLPETSFRLTLSTTQFFKYFRK